MKNPFAALITIIAIPTMACCQTATKIANDAFVITRMADKFHVQPRAVDDAFSTDVFKAMLTKTDGDKIFFTQNDIARLNKYNTAIDDEIKQRKTGYITLFTALYAQRLKQADSLVNEIAKKPFNLNLPAKYTAAEKNAYPQSVADMQVKLDKTIKAQIIYELTDDLPPNFKSFNPVKQKKYLDSAVISLQKNVTSSYKRRINNILQNPYGITQYMGNLYCEAIASAFDPHTEFLPPEEKENFESELGKQPFLFGFNMKADKNGGVLIEGLEPGSPAFKGGLLKKGDKFITVQWEGKPPVDVADISMQDFEALMDESNHAKALFTVRRPDGTLVKVPLQKEQIAVTDDDEGKVKSFILKGKNTVGYIYLPDFYEDWETGNNGLNGCANDVGREIIKLKKENINGLILDLRYNGGGSAEEATELAGIFIDAGPVEQEKERDGKVRTYKDVNRGTLYDGPLVILVNGASASASELLAGSLQDYNRAVIVGSPTYGKATAQVILPMDTTVTYDNVQTIKTEDYLKITVSKLYRVNGTTAQFTGVQPDIVLPDVLDAYITKEADEPTALRPNTIAPNKYYEPYPPLPIKDLEANLQPEIDNSKYFNTVKSFATKSKQLKTVKDISLNLKDALAEDELNRRDNDSTLDKDTSPKKYTVQNNRFEDDRIKADSTFKELNEEFAKQITDDAYISVAYDVIDKLKKP